MSKLSAVVSVYNEEKNIEKCLKSLSFADEIIVVDNGSLDNTRNIAKKYTDKIYSQKNDPQNIDLQKNFGIDKAKSEWVLIVDADEEITPELSKEILDTIESRSKDVETQINGCWIPRKNYIFGKWIQNTGWYPDLQLRLFRRGKGRYVHKHVHEVIKIEGNTEKLKNDLVHHNYSGIKQFVNKALVYTENEANFMIDNGYSFSYLDAIRFPLDEFIRRFFSRQGYKDGLHGLALSILMAFYHFLIFTFIWEKQGFKEHDNENFFQEVEDEFKRSGRDINYWIRKEKLENIKNPFKKNISKIREKIRI